MSGNSKRHTTNYQNAFIQVAEDCPVAMGEVPPLKVDNKSMACLQFEMLINAPYAFTSDEVLFGCYAQKHAISAAQQLEAREVFFSKGQPCFRASPLTKRYGWGVHADADGRIAIYAQDSSEYRKLASDRSIQQFRAMRGGKR